MNLKKLIAGLAISLIFTNWVIADSSTNYTVDVSELNGGGELSASSSYRLNDTFIGFVDGNFGYSTNYTLGSGLVYLEQLCGNGILEFGEQCDDGNTISGDGCSATCQTEAVPAVCGNGVVEAGEECDDGNLISGDGCSAACTLEGAPSGGGGGVIKYLCGNGIKDPGEQCDDGNNISGDGCNSICQIEGVSERTFTVKTRPEKRVNPTQNWRTTATLAFLSKETGTVTFSTQVSISDTGWGTLMTSQIPDGVYDVSLKGLSHLTKVMRNVDINADTHTLDFTFGETFYLTAGDVHESKDDFINALDITAAVKALYTSDVHADLNKDGLVNALDITITVNNLYRNGESF